MGQCLDSNRRHAHQGRYVGEAHRLGHQPQLVKPSAVLHRLAESLGMPRSDGVVEPCGDGLVSKGHDPVHGSYALGASLHAFQAAGAVPHTGRLVQGLQSLSGDALGVAVPGVGGEPVGLGEGRRSQEGRVNLHYRAVGDAGPAHDAGRYAGKVQHRFVGGYVFLFRFRTLGLEVGRYLHDFVPEEVEIDH